MSKEIIVNAGEAESRVAILENGRLMELHVERDPKIVGNIYKGRVTKVLKGMDAAFVDIGVERNAFLSVSDVVPEEEEHEGHGGNGRINRRNLPPITQLLRNNQEILVQVARAPMGTKGARITTRLSLPGRYMVLMLNSGSYVGVSRKVVDSRERHRLRDIANEIRPEGYSLIVRTEAEGKSEEELRGDMEFLLDMARRIESKADKAPVPSLVHGDLTLVFRLIRDAFTRDVNRLVVDSPDAYEAILDLVGMLAPRLKNRVFLYEEETPIFHAYNIEPEIERTLRRRVWLPSGGYLIIDQAEALTAIDVNTGRFVGSVELAETVLTTNLQAAEEVARQLRLRDLGGIIVVDFIDMDNPRHRQQVTRAFEEALTRDRAKIKVHSISPLGLVEMTRKRTGESLHTLLTEPCPYCAGIGRVQNAMTMALRIERDLATAAVEHKDAEAFLLHAHPRVIASMLGYEGEAQRDLEDYIKRPVYLRMEDNFHPNAYHLERLTLEQALVAVPTLEEGEEIEAQVVNPDPEVSQDPLLMARGIFLIAPGLDAPVGARVRVRITEVGTSIAIAEPLAAEQRTIRTDARTMPLERPSLVPEWVLPPYLREERLPHPPHGISLLSPTAKSVPAPEGEELPEILAPVESFRDRLRKRRRRRDVEKVVESTDEAQPLLEEIVAPVLADEELIAAIEEAEETVTLEGTTVSSRRRRRRRRNRQVLAAIQDVTTEVPAPEESGELEAEETELVEGAEPVEAAEVVEEEEAAAEAASPAAERRRRRRRPRRRGERALVSEETPATAEAPLLEPLLEELSPDVAAEALMAMLNAIPDVAEGTEETEVSVPAEEAEVPTAEEVAALADAVMAAGEVTALEAVEEETPAPETPEAPAELAEVAPEAAAVVEEAEAEAGEEVAPKPRRRTRARRPRTKPVVEVTSEEPLPASEPPVLPAVAPETLPTPAPETLPLPVEEAVVPEPQPEAAPVAEEAPVEVQPDEVVEVKPARKRRTTTTRRRTKKMDTPEEPPAPETPKG